jgi:hypothetical protein
VFFTSCKKNANHDLAELQPAENFDISKAPFDSTLVVTFFESHPLLQNTSLMLINYIKNMIFTTWYDDKMVSTSLPMFFIIK